MPMLFRGFFIAVHLCILVTFAAGYLGRFIDPHAVWWLQLFAIVFPAVALLLAIFTTLAAAMRVWWLLALSFVALVLFGLRYTDAIGGSDAFDEASITVVTFNTGGTELLVRGSDRGIRPLIAEYRPDVFCLQEFWVGWWETSVDGSTRARANIILDSLGYEIAAPPSRTAQHRPSPIISRLEFEETSVIRLSSRESQEPAATLHRAQFSRHGQSFAVYNLHLQSFTERRPWREAETFSLRAWIRFLRRTRETFLQRADEARDIREILEREDLPFLLCGDFNTTPHQWTYYRIAAGLTDAFRASGGFWGPTYPSSFPLVRIDFVLTSPEWSVGEVDVGRVNTSDHRPVIVRLRLDR